MYFNEGYIFKQKKIPFQVYVYTGVKISFFVCIQIIFPLFIPLLLDVQYGFRQYSFNVTMGTHSYFGIFFLSPQVFNFLSIFLVLAILFSFGLTSIYGNRPDSKYSSTHGFLKPRKLFLFYQSWKSLFSEV